MEHCAGISTFQVSGQTIRFKLNQLTIIFIVVELDRCLALQIYTAEQRAAMREEKKEERRKERRDERSPKSSKRSLPSVDRSPTPKRRINKHRSRSRSKTPDMETAALALMEVTSLSYRDLSRNVMA